MSGEARNGDVEALAREREVLGPADDVRSHARRGIAAHHCAARFAEPPGHVTAARSDVERGHTGARPTPLDDEVEIRALAVRPARAGRLRALVPELPAPANLYP